MEQRKTRRKLLITTLLLATSYWGQAFFCRESRNDQKIA